MRIQTLGQVLLMFVLSRDNPQRRREVSNGVGADRVGVKFPISSSELQFFTLICKERRRKQRKTKKVRKANEKVQNLGQFSSTPSTAKPHQDLPNHSHSSLSLLIVVPSFLALGLASLAWDVRFQPETRSSVEALRIRSCEPPAPSSL